MFKLFKRKKDKQKNVFWLGLISYFTDFSSEMLMPILPIFFQDTLGLNKALIGLIEGTAESFSSFMKVISGYISDKIKKRKIFIVIGYAIPAFMKPLYVFASSWWSVFILRFIERSGKGLRDPPRDALIAASVKEKNYGSAFGFHRMMDTLGAVTGVLALAIILHFLPNTLKPIFLIAFIPGVISFILAGAKVQDDKKIKESKKKISLKSIVHMPSSYKFFLIPTFIFAIGNMSYAFFILRAENLGLAIVYIPLVYLVYTMTYAATALPAGTLSDKIGRIPAIILGNVFFLLACVLFAMPLPASISWIVFVLYGLFYAFNVGVSKAYISNIVPREQTATAIGIHNFIMGICALPASLIVGSLWNWMDASVAFGYSATLTVISTIFYVAMLFRFKGQAR
ncbi:MFS transporter [Patescibacteria group bacterium]